MQQLISFLKEYELVINFFCHFTVFIGGFYIAIHSRKIATWLRTCLWYIGCSSFLITISVVLQWVLGADFELSYANTQIISHTLLYMWIVITTLVFFLKTVAIDIKHSKQRKSDFD